MASLFDGLPAPKQQQEVTPSQQPAAQGEGEQGRSFAHKQQAKFQPPRYGERSGFVPRREVDYGDGGAFPEIHVAQFPRGLGKEKSRARNQTLALTVNGSGDADYGALHRQGGNRSKTVYSEHSALVPSLHNHNNNSLDKPSEEEVEETARRTAAALQGKVDTVLSAAQPKALAPRPGEARYVKYTPAGGSSASGASQRVIRISDAHVDPLEPPKFKHKKVPRGPGSPPVPVMHSPPRKLTHEDQKDWSIPPCISNWKNRKGYTIPLDKRLAADGRGLQEMQINDNFAKLSEALYVAEQKAREAIDMRSKIQKEILTKEKMKKEDELRALAQKARMERTGQLGARQTDDHDHDHDLMMASGSTATAMGRGRGPGPAYEPVEERDVEERDRDRDRDSRGGARAGAGAGAGAVEEEEEEGGRRRYGGDFEGEEGEGRETKEDRELRRKREELREERRRERERERRLEERERHGFKKSKLTRDRDRDISEKVALGQASVGASMGGEALYDQRLFNQDQGIASGLATEDTYNIYDKPLFADKGNSIYRPKTSADDELYGQEATEAAIRTERFKADKGFAGTASAGASARGGARVGGPVQFEKEAEDQDPFDLEGLIGDVRGGSGSGGGRKKPLDHVGKSGGMNANAGGADFNHSSSGRKKVDFKRGSN